LKEKRFFNNGADATIRILGKILFPWLVQFRPIFQTASLFLPFALLRLITFRPDFLRMRTRKPWVLFLRVFFIVLLFRYEPLVLARSDNGWYLSAFAMESAQSGRKYAVKAFLINT
jgi:hypothetical protein